MFWFGFFSFEIQTYQVDLKPNGSEIMVTNENKREYIEYVYIYGIYRDSCTCLRIPLTAIAVVCAVLNHQRTF